MVDFRTELQPQARSLLGEQQAAVGLQAELPSIADKLRDALQARLEHPLMGQRAEAIGEFFQAGPKAREEAQTLLGAPGAPARPTAVESLVSQRRASALTPVMGLTGLIGAKLGGIEDVIQKGTNAFQSLVGAQQGRVGLAQTSYNLALNQLIQQAQQEQWQAEQSRSAEQQKLDRIQQQLAMEIGLKETTGGTVTLPSGETIKIPSALERLIAGRAPKEPKSAIDQTIEDMLLRTLTEQIATPTEPKPNRTPEESGHTDTGRVWTSERGEWYYDWETRNWIPVIQ